MKRSVFTGLVFATLTTTLLTAQPRQPNQRQEAQDRMAENAARLKLTDDQKKQVGQILQDEREKGRAIRQKYQGQQTPNRHAMMQELKALHDDADSRLSKVLKPDQMQEWKKIQEENRERRHENMQRQRAQQPPQQQPPQQQPQ